MKIIDVMTLLKQPQGTLFATYTPGAANVGEISIFGGKSIPDPENVDFVYAAFNPLWLQLPDGVGNWHGYWNDVMEKGGEAKIDFECYGRNGLYDKEEQFVLLDKEDTIDFFRVIAKSLLKAHGVTDFTEILKDLDK